MKNLENLSNDKKDNKEILKDALKVITCIGLSYLTINGVQFIVDYSMNSDYVKLADSFKNYLVNIRTIDKTLPLGYGTMFGLFYISEK